MNGTLASVLDLTGYLMTGNLYVVDGLPFFTPEAVKAYLDEQAARGRRLSAMHSAYRRRNR